MAGLAAVLLLVTLNLAAIRYGVDSRPSGDWRQFGS
jgi:hypothetical protein